MTGASTVLAVVLVLALVMMFGPDLLNPKPNWTEAQVAEVEIFLGALEQYQQATLATKQGMLRDEDWETVRALLEASGSEMSMVSEEVLKEIHPELPVRVEKHFLPGIRMGTYGLLFHTALSPKGTLPSKDTARIASQDSLARGRDLLTKWSTWFDTTRVEILSRTE